MDRRFLTVLGVSLVFALVVSSVFYQMTARSSNGGAEATSTSAEVDVVVAARPLGVGVMVKTPDIKLVKMPAVALPKGAFTKVEEVLDRPVISNILLDEPILDGRLAAKGSGLGLAPTIPMGMRAVTVRVNDVAGVAGFVLPGMRVDVLVTGTPPKSEGSMTNTVLQNMLVLSAGKELQADARGNAMPTPTVTLMATPAEAETLTLSNSEGRIQLVLRNSSDQEVAPTTGSFVAELYGGNKRSKVTTQAAPAPRPRPAAAAAPKAEVAAPPPPPAPPAGPPEVVVIRGVTRSVEVVSKPAPISN
ncbi:MAG: Flp pilus assembly protein CpaB [Acidobacteriota bacterium]